MEVADVHKRMKSLMQERNLTPYRLAMMMDVTPSSIYNMMKRKTMPKIETIERVCNAIDISVSDFFVFTGTNNNVGYVSDDELTLLETYRSLTLNERERLKAYAEGIKGIDKNKKS
jgi:transcriptional regulator with XRE-family HTH domain